MRLLKRFAHATSFLVLLIMCCAISSAQEEKQDRQTVTPPTGLSLEVNPKGGPPSHHSVPGMFFGGRVRRLPSSPPTTDETQPQTTFMVRHQMEGDAVRIKVFAWTDKFHEQEILIGDFLLREGEKATVAEMTRFGYEPMELTIVKVKPAPVLLPSVESKLPSVEVVSVEAEQTNFPSYKVTLRNLSYKDIAFLEIQTFRAGRLTTTHWPRGEQDRPLVKAGETFEDRVIADSAGGVKQGDGYTPSSPQSIEVVTAVFSDKSYEGSRQSASQFVAGQRARKIQITRALTLLQAAAEARAAGERAALESLNREVSALDRNAQQDTIDEILAEFPGLPLPQAHEPLKAFIELGLNQVRKELLKDISEYAQMLDHGSVSKPYSVWVANLRQKYEAWLSRL
jgi:hypothetical protein